MKKPKDKTAAVVLAIFLNYWSWIYTWKVNWWKWLVCFGTLFVLGFSIIGMILVFPVCIGFWIWAIVDNARRDKNWYKNYTV